MDKEERGGQESPTYSKRCIVRMPFFSSKLGYRKQNVFASEESKDAENPIH